MKKNVLNYIACTAAIMVAAALLLGGGLWSLCGVLWSALLYASGDAFKGVWRRFWVSNIKILSYFNCL